MKEFDAIIIGAGIVGCSIALSLARRGKKTLNVDALPSAGYGSTSHSSAIVRPFYSHEVSCAIAHEARHRWLEWREHLGDIADPIANYAETGGLVLIRDGTEDEYEKNLAVLRTVGVNYTLLSPTEIERLYPGINLRGFGPPRRKDEPGFGDPVGGNISSAIYIPAAGYVSDPQLAATNLQVAAANEGSTFRFNCRVTNINRDLDSVTGVELDHNEQVATATVINAAGPHSSAINELAGISESLKISTRPHRHEVAYLKAPPGYQKNAGFVVDLDAGVYQRPDGADMLIGSADPACDPPDIVDPDGYNDQFTEQWTTQVMRAAQRWPDLGIENNARGTVGIYDVTDDWIPVYDQSDLKGFYLAIGTSGNQFKNAPVIGDLMASILDNKDHDAVPSTLHLPHLYRSVDLSFYSRNREVQKTASVMA